MHYVNIQIDKSADAASYKPHLLLISTERERLCSFIPSKRTTRKEPPLWWILRVIRLSISVCRPLRAARWRPQSWLKAGAVRRLLNYLWQAGVWRIVRRLLRQRGGRWRCRRCLHSVSQKQLSTWTSYTQVNGHSAAAPMCHIWSAAAAVQKGPKLILMSLTSGFERDKQMEI